MTNQVRLEKTIKLCYGAWTWSMSDSDSAIVGADGIVVTEGEHIDSVEYVPFGEVEMTISCNVLTRSEATLAEIKQLRRAKKQELARAEQAVTILDEKIQSLLAITAD